MGEIDGGLRDGRWKMEDDRQAKQRFRNQILKG